MREEPNYVEMWLSTVMACTYLKERAKVTAYGLSTFATWKTGRDCRPSDARLAERIGVTPRTARRGRLDLEAVGFIRRTSPQTGPKHSRQPVEYVLVMRPTTDKVVPSESGSTDKVVPSGTDTVVPSDLRDYGQVRQSLRTAEAVTTDKVVLQPPHTSSRPLESEEGGESAYAPPPDGGAHALPAVQAAVMATLRRRWNGQTPAMSNRIRSRLTELLTAGWTQAQIVAGVATISDKPKNPVLLLEAHLKRLLDDHAPGDFEDVSTFVDTFQVDAQQRIVAEMERVFTAAKSQGWTLTGSKPDEDNERQLDLTGHGCTITVYVNADTGIPSDPEVSVSLARPVSAERLAALRAIAHNNYVYGDGGNPEPRHGEVSAPNVTDVPATVERIMATFRQSPKASGKSTPTPRDVSEVLAADTRQPGPEGFGHFDPPGREQHRPPGHDQAVRQADDLERLRQVKALEGLTQHKENTP